MGEEGVQQRSRISHTIMSLNRHIGTFAVHFEPDSHKLRQSLLMFKPKGCNGNDHLLAVRSAPLTLQLT